MSANDTTARTTRGGALTRLLLLVGGAVGVGAGADRVVKSRGGGEAVVLFGRDWRLGPHVSEHGKRAGPAEARTPRGRIVDRSGLELGTFTAASLLGSGGALELHSFDLADGTIVGVGAAGSTSTRSRSWAAPAATRAPPGRTSRGSRRGSSAATPPRSSTST